METKAENAVDRIKHSLIQSSEKMGIQEKNSFGLLDLITFMAAAGFTAYGVGTIRKSLIRPPGKIFRKGSLLEETGFSYDGEQDIFYSIQKPWQKQFGYCRFYDFVAPFMNLIYDSEPIRFDYDGKHWLIQLWKGQYGMTTGCEVGVYTTEEDSRNAMYQAAGPEDQLPIAMSLIKDGKVLFTRQEKHWWLTGFVLGEFSEPEELSALIQITLKTQQMCKAFVGALKRIGYQSPYVLRDRKTVRIMFDKPYSSQPITRRAMRKLAQKANKTYCDLYQAII
jgi:hypothetical protein